MVNLITHTHEGKGTLEFFFFKYEFGYRVEPISFSFCFHHFIFIKYKNQCGIFNDKRSANVGWSPEKWKRVTHDFILFYFYTLSDFLN